MAMNPPGITWDDDPAPGGFYMGPDPLEEARERAEEERKRRAAQNSDISTGISVRNEGRQVANDAFSQAATLREKFSAYEPVKNYNTLIRYYGIAANAEDTTPGDQTLINAFAKMQNPDSTVMQGEFDSAAENDTGVQQIVTKLKREFGWDGAGRISPQAREWMLNEMQSIAVGANQQYNQAREYYADLAKRYGFDPEEVIGPHAGLPFKDDIYERRLELKRDGKPDNYRAAGPGGGEVGFTGYDEENGLQGRVSFAGETEEQRRARELAERRYSMESDAARVARQGLTLGLSDEAAGVGGALGRALTGDFNLAQNYRISRDADALNNERSRENLGWAGTGLELLGGGGALRGVANMGLNAARTVASRGAINPSTFRGAVQSQLARSAGIDGAAAGGIGGFGYGRGTEESTGGAAIGAATGGLLGYGGQTIGNRIANRAPGITPEMRAVAQAGQAEGIMTPNAMLNPRSGNAVARVDATMLGGPRLQAGMEGVSEAIEGRVNALGRGGNALLSDAGKADRVAVGNLARNAAERQITQTGRIAARRYDAAERLAGNAKVTPQESLARVDSMIARLSETPGTNAAELNFLQSLKGDLSQDLTVGGLRRMRTSLRKRISKGELTFGEDEANVLAIMDGAADDIERGLIQQGKGNAATAFRRADNAYRARMEYINGTLQKLIGKRNANLPPEAVADRLASIAKNDAVGLRKFYASLEPDEAADIAATMAETLGRNNKGEFSLPIFQTQTANMDDRTIRTVFGPRGAESVRNLRLLAREADRVQRNMNSRKSGTAVAMKDVLLGLLTGGTPALATAANGGGGLGMALTAGAGLALQGTAQVLSARSLMSPRLSRWILNAPRSNNPAAVRAHVARLGSIVKAEPALANEVGVIRQMFGANDNWTARAVASPDPDEEQ